ncbi:hypothetical protein Hanom_Chr06g00515521 [Helianthus anomalus]
MQCCVDNEDEISNLDFGTTTWNCIWSFACTGAFTTYMILEGADGIIQIKSWRVEKTSCWKCTKILKRVIKDKKRSSNLCEKILTVSDNMKVIMRKVMKQLLFRDQDK